MRLIDADALYAALMEESAVIARGTGRNCLALACKSVADMVQDAPTIDAVPVRHGKWERNSARIAGWVKGSECGNMEPLLCTTHFCGHCGAEMEDFDETD